MFAWELVILLYTVLNMNIFLAQTHRFASDGLYYPLCAFWSSFIMDGFTF